MTERHVFVYGTLRRGEVNDINRLLPAPRLEGQGVILGTMYHLGAYPGVVLGPGGVVVGEVYLIEPALERILDKIEGIEAGSQSEYVKRELMVKTDEGQLACLVYEIKSEVAMGKPVIANGDWVRGRTS